MGATDSRYKLEQLPDGFIISGEDRVTTTVKLDENKLGLTVKKSGGYWDYGNTVGLIEGRDLISTVARGLMDKWQPRPRGDGKKVNTQKLKSWAISKTGRALSKVIKGERLRLIEQVDPQVVAIQKSVFAASGKFAVELLEPHFYTKDKYYLKDVVNFRAAAMTVFGGIQPDDYSDKDEMANKDWKKLYVSRGKEVYTSLNKTLTKLPGGIPINFLANFPRLHLERPVYSRRELLFQLGCVSHHEWVDINNYRDCHMLSNNIPHILLNASAEEITRAAKKLGDHLRTPINLRKAFEVNKVSQYIMDAAPVLTHNGNLVGLMEKAIEYHRQQVWNKSGLPGETLTATPSIPLPTHKDIIFLDSVGKINEEGEVQHHCIASYAREAVVGKCFLFHINHGGFTASAQVSAETKRVVQCYGPSNQTNAASTWATKELNKWAEGLKPVDIYIDPIPF